MPPSIGVTARVQIVNVSGSVHSKLVEIESGAQVLVYVYLEDGHPIESGFFPFERELAVAHGLYAPYSLTFLLPRDAKSYSLLASYVVNGEIAGDVEVNPDGWSDPIAVSDKSAKNFVMIPAPIH
jgi:hypothetical protein